MTLLPMSQSRRRNSLSTLQYQYRLQKGHCSLCAFTASTNCYFWYIIPETHQRATLVFFSHFIIFAVHPLFFVSYHRTLLIYVKLGFLGPQGTLLVFFFFLFIPKTESCPRSRAAVRGENSQQWSLDCFSPASVYLWPSKHKSELKYSFVSQSDAAAFSFSARCSRISALKPVFRDLKRRTWANPHCSCYLFREEPQPDRI